MRYFLKGCLVLLAVGAVVSAGGALLWLGAMVLPFLLMGAFYLLRAALALAVIGGIVAAAIYLPYALGKAISRQGKSDNAK